MAKDDLEELFTRGVSSLVDPGGSFKEKVLKKARGEYPGDIIIKLGADPNRPDIHIGHAVILRRLRQFQDVGCKVVFLVGDFTARIGDPTGKSKVRPEIEQAEVDHNAKTYIDQIKKILRVDDPRLFSWIRNSDWFTGVTDISLPDDAKIEMDVSGNKINIPPNSFIGKAVAFEQSRMQVRDLGLKDRVSVVTLAGLLWSLKHITHSQLIARDMFQERIKRGEELYMHEVMYPVLQGIDSVVLAQIYGSCDLEIGGSDQTFNMLIGRDVMRANSQLPQAVMALDILTGLDGVEKMSKSLDNYIGITEPPQEMFGKVMSVPDNVMPNYFTLATYTPLVEVAGVMKSHPRDAKLRLAREIVSIYHGEKAAKSAEQGFLKTFSDGGIPDDIQTVKAGKDKPLVDILMENGLVSSKTEFNRLEKAGAIKEIENGVYRIGKHRFLRVELY
ncbi:MAG: tyrosine--tRNA ligase [bacterium]|nr:tyrosine--tRNA ligase [bacterium]